MKRYTKYIILTAIGLLITFAPSCNYLDRDADDFLTLDMVFEDKIRTMDWLAGVYAGVPDAYWGYAQNLEPFADDLSPSEGWEPYGWNVITKIKGNWNANSPWDMGFWDGLPKRIRNGYIFIDRVHALESQQLSRKEVELMKLEVRFLIAYYYSLMAQYHGAIPLQTWLSDFNDSSENLMLGQTSFDEVVNWVDKELLEVSKQLPAYYTESNKYGRATSVMALAVRARFLLFAASPLTNGNPDPAYIKYTNNKGERIFNTDYDPQKWVRATNACKELIDLAHASGHGLYYEFNKDGSIDPFLSYQNMLFTRFDQGNKETLFPVAGNQRNTYDSHATPRGLGGNGGLGVSQSLVDAFFMKNGLPIDASGSGYSEKGFSTSDEYRQTRWIESKGSVENAENPVTLAGTYNMYCNREPRFYISVLYNEAWHRIGKRKTNFYSGGVDGGPTHDSPQNGYLVRKKVHPDYDKLNNVYPYRATVLYRLGEAYLNYAEALNETAPGSADIVKYLNLIRERAGIPAYGTASNQLPIPSTQDEMRKAIRRERRVELNCESGIRYDDIRRWMIGEEMLNREFYGMNASGTEKSDDINNPKAFFVRKPYIKRVFNKKSYWFPVHQNQIDKNPNLRQLPHW